MFCMLKKWYIYPAYVSKHSSSSEKQVIPLMIPNGEGWHYLAVKNTRALSRGITSKNNGDFIVWIVFISLEQETNLNRKREYVKIKMFVMLLCFQKKLKY